MVVVKNRSAGSRSRARRQWSVAWRFQILQKSLRLRTVEVCTRHRLHPSTLTKWRTQHGADLAAVQRLPPPQGGECWSTACAASSVLVLALLPMNQAALHIKYFHDAFENALKTQVWIAVSVYVVVTTIKKNLPLDASLHTISQILCVTLRGEISYQQTLSESRDDSQRLVSTNQPHIIQFLI